MGKIRILTIWLLITIIIQTGCNGVEEDKVSQIDDDVLHINLLNDFNTGSGHEDVWTWLSEPFISELLYISLTDIDPSNGQVVPALAQSWHVDESNTIWTFHLRNDVYWIGIDQDGNHEKLRPVNADDILLASERDPVLDSVGAPHWMYWGIVKNCEKIDDFTIEFELLNPMEDFHQYTPFIDGTMISGDDFQFVGDLPIGNGPFMMIDTMDSEYHDLGEWVSENGIVLQKNPFYPEDTKGLPDEILLTWENQDTALQKLENNELDMVEITHPMEFNTNQAELIYSSGRFFLINPDKKEMAHIVGGYAGYLFNTRPILTWIYGYLENQPSSCDDAVFTYENSSIINTYNKGEYDQNSKVTITNPSLDDIVYAVESGKIVRLSEYCFGEGWVKFSDVPFITSINRVANEDESHNLCLVDIETGKDQLALIWDMQEWYDPDQNITINTIDVYEPYEDTCFFATSYIGFNLDKVPLEIRKTLAYGFDKTRFLMETFGTNVGHATGFIPSLYLYSFDEIHLKEDLERELIFDKMAAIEWTPDSLDIENFILKIAYCGECEGSDWMSENVVKIWDENLGIQIEEIPISFEEYRAPIKDIDAEISLSAYEGSSWFDFLHDAIKQGKIMVPEEEYESVMEMIENTALERDEVKRADLVLEIEKKLVKEYVSLIPLNYYERCE